MRGTCISVLIMMLITVSQSLFAQVPNWNDTVITELSGNAYQKAISKQSIQIGSDNSIHVVYGQDNGEGWEMYYIYRDISEEWSIPELITPDFGYSNNIALVLTPYQNDIRLFATSNGALYEVSRDDMGDWVTESISTGTSNIGYIDATIDAQGYIHIVGISSNVADEPKLIYLTDFNGNWEYNVMMDCWLGPYGLGASPVIAADTSGIVAIAYRGGTYMEYHIHLAQNAVAGEFTWTYEIISTPNANDLSCDIVIVDNTIHLAHSGQDGWGFPWRTYYTKRHVNSLIWTAPELVSGTLSLVDPTLVVDLEGNIHVVMVEVDGNFMTGLIHYSTNVTDSWVVSNPFGIDDIWEYPTLRLDHAGNFHLLKINFSFDGGMQYGLVHRGAGYQMVLPTPLNLVAEVDGFNAVLNWDTPDIPDELSDIVLEGYNLWRQTFGAGPYEVINDELIETTEYTDINLYPGQYSYYVTAVYLDEGESGQSNTVNLIIMDQLPPPVADPPEGEYENFVYVTLSSPNEIGNIHYTLDGEEPTLNSPLFENLILIEESVVLKARTFHPDWQPSQIIEVEYTIITTGIDEDYPVIRETTLFAARPNPFNPDTVISFSLREASPVNITIYNILGQKVKVLVDDHKEAGLYEVHWNGRDRSGTALPSGVYFYRMVTTDSSFINKMMLLK